MKHGTRGALGIVCRGGPCTAARLAGLYAAEWEPENHPTAKQQKSADYDQSCWGRKPRDLHDVEPDRAAPDHGGGLGNVHHVAPSLKVHVISDVL